MGQILANFYLKPFYRDPKTRKQKNWVDLEHEKTVREFRASMEITYCVNVKLALFGIRNLLFKAV